MERFVMFLGICLGLAAALCQSFAYLFSRVFVQKYHKSIVHLLIVSHMIMGLFALILLWWIWPGSMPSLQHYALSLLGTTVFYIMGQACLFLALEKSAASRASPLLGLKVFLLALIGVAFFDQPLNGMQWFSVLLSVAAALILNGSGQRIPWQSIVFVLLACLGYSLCDLNIKVLIGHFDYLGLARAATMSLCLSYILCAVTAGAVFLQWPNTTREMWKAALPYSITWFTAMLFLFACFGCIGVVFGNIVLSTRGIFSILIGYCAAHAGYNRLEEKVTKLVFVRRFIAGGLMVLAIALFYL